MSLSGIKSWVTSSVFRLVYIFGIVDGNPQLHGPEIDTVKTFFNPQFATVGMAGPRQCSPDR